MEKVLTAAQRLIVAADFKPPHSEGKNWVADKVFGLADSLKDTGICLKVNSALRAYGYGMIEEIHSRGLEVFADLKLFDIKETLSIDGILLREAKPELLTVVCTTGIDAMTALKVELPDTEVLGVSVLTNLTDKDTQAMFICSTKEAVLRFAKNAPLAKIDGLISAGAEAEMLRAEFGMALSINTPAIRPLWAIVKEDDQNANRSLTPHAAIKAGATRIIVGRPITQAANPYDAVMRTIDEIKGALK